MIGDTVMTTKHHANRFVSKKSVDRNEIEEHVKKTLGKFEDGRHKIAPKVSEEDRVSAARGGRHEENEEEGRSVLR